MLFGKTTASGNHQFVAEVRDLSGNTSQGSFMLVVKQPGLAPAITSIVYKKKKVFLTGDNFEEGAMVYVDGEGLTASLDGSTLKTQKRKQKVGLHFVYVVNPDGKQSGTFQFIVE
jgi:murein tripeptide amidase MpaA